MRRLPTPLAPDGMTRAIELAPTSILLRRPGLSYGTGGRTSCYLPPVPPGSASRADGPPGMRTGDLSPAGRKGRLRALSSALLAVAATLTPAAALLPHGIQRLAAIPVGLALAWLGYALWSERRGQASDPANPAL